MANKPGIEFRPPLTKVQAAIAKRAREMLDRTVPNAQVAAFLDSWVQRNFRGEGSLTGGWTPFKRGGRWIPGFGLDTSAKLLQDTGALRASFRAFYDSDVVGIGSDIEYSRYHEEGTGTIPQRRMLPQEEDVRVDVLTIYDRHFKSLAEKRLW